MCSINISSKKARLSIEVKSTLLFGNTLGIACSSSKATNTTLLQGRKATMDSKRTRADSVKEAACLPSQWGRMAQNSIEMRRSSAETAEAAAPAEYDFSGIFWCEGQRGSPPLLVGEDRRQAPPAPAVVTPPGAAAKTSQWKSMLLPWRAPTQRPTPRASVGGKPPLPVEQCAVAIQDAARSKVSMSCC
jgi:hypothetical protein